MKKLLYIVILLLSFSGCLKSTNTKQWCQNCPEADSIMNLFTLSFAEGVPDDSLQKIAEPLGRLHCDARKNQHLEALLHYTRARRMSRQGNDSALYEIQEALAGSDSVTWPYAHVRFKNLASIITFVKGKLPVHTFYGDLKSYQDYYSRIGDTLALAETMTHLVVVFSSAGEEEGAKDFVDMAHDYFRKLALNNYILKNSLNVAGSMAANGDTLGAVSLLDSIYSVKESYADSSFFNELLLSRWKIIRDTVSLNKFIDRFEKLRVVSNKINFMYAEKSLMFSSIGRSDSALFYANLATHGINHINNLEALNTIYAANAEAWYRINETDSALHYLRLKDQLTPHIIAGENANNLRSLRVKTAIMEADAKAEAIRETNKSRLIITILSCVSLILVVVFILQRRISQAKIREEKARTEAEQKNRQLAISACALQEKENVIESMRQIINRNKEEGKLSTSAAQELNTSINIYLDNNEEWDNLNMLHSAIHPGFADEMRRLYPEISDSKLQLASYIVAGLTSKQIARLMKIQPDSVKKARWKLRTMMALPTEASLEQSFSEIHKRLDPY